MAKYSIKDLENFTKIKAHTLRIWEQRYNLLNPQRTDTNIRYYSDRDLKKILNINLLYSNGLKISKIAKLTEEELFQKASEILISEDTSYPDEVNKFVTYVMELDDLSIQQSLNKLVDKIGMERMYSEILVPLLEKIGTLWQVDAISVSHEHFVSNLIREFLIVRIDKVPIATSARAKVVLFLHEGEKHELSLLFYYYILKSRAYDCFYLGQSVPMRDLKTFVKEIKPDYLITSFIAETSEDEIAAFFNEVSAFFDLRKIYAGGYQLVNHSKVVPKEINQIQGINDINL
ncbi:MerR family transcriptional regulator [Paracrocinitomix mangrovi]|uniref:MerR family transcriptional regulator n=1 Tax=Paracrocinitomix mangrovi TaxID=2862509 RepID=UPI001C8F096A|nr:MerR family transcriptional regulator [Paracrocinitomix mangrovi]UKN03619.1 MerR family transcriptional regulator [Paracrocinitomix mangrovi]